MKTKAIAFHLPQYHTIPENDKWWGTGFTDWNNVKKAKPLFHGHKQPRIPEDNNYYDMTDLDTLKRQCFIANEYGVYGFCYYHYWFHGHMLLEKPVEILREHTDIQTNYCFCWANETWARTWDGKEKDILIKQEYGEKEDWIKHIDYLYSFFKDDRYIKIDGHPMLVIYKTEEISSIDAMLDVWNEYLRKREMETIWLVEMMTGTQIKPCVDNSKAVVEFEPSYTQKLIDAANPIKAKAIRLYRKLKHLPIPKCIRKYFLVRIDYEDICNKIESRNIKYGSRDVFPGAFVGWDNTPRKGIGGSIFYNDSVERFEKLLTRQKDKADRMHNSYVFINAWNEWAEGTYLEPDKERGYKNLEIMKKIFK